jgi:hypothetical protein
MRGCLLSITHHICFQLEDSGPAGLPKSVEEVWKRNFIVILCDVYKPLYMRYHAPMLFTCTAVLSHLAVKGEWMCEIWIIGTNSMLLCGPRQTRKIQYGRESRKGSVYPRTRPEGAERSSRSSMYKMYISIILQFIKEEKNGILSVWFIVHVLFFILSIAWMIVVYA